jgi:hypothetical protein
MDGDVAANGVFLEAVAHYILKRILKAVHQLFQFHCVDGVKLFLEGSGHKDGGGVFERIEGDAAKGPDIPFEHEFLAEFGLSLLHFEQTFRWVVGAAEVVGF